MTMTKQYERFNSSTFMLLISALAFGACDDPDEYVEDAELAEQDVEEADAEDAEEADAGAADAIDGLTQAARPAAAKFPCRLLALGDSITYGWNGNWQQQSDPSGNYLGGFRPHLVWGFQLFPSATVGPVQMVGIRQDNSPPWLVNWGQSWHAGAPGFTNKQLADAVVAGATNFNPDIILLHAGTNDIISGPAPKVSRAIGDLYVLLEKLRIRHPYTKILLAKIIPVAGPLNADVTAYNAQLDAVAANVRSIGQSVWTVDHNTNFPVATLEDGVHPNQTGYVNMAGRWRAALDAHGCW